MAKQDLTPAGVTAAFDALYQLPDTGLQEQAALIRSDLKGWVFDNFNVTTHQEAFINGLGSGYTAALSEQLARAVVHRWPVIFAPQQPKNAPRSDKWVRSKEEDEAGDGTGENNGTHTGSLTITTGYH